MTLFTDAGYLTAFGEIKIADRTIQGKPIPDDTWRRAFRMHARGLLNNPYDYIGEWCWFKGILGGK